jgi:hypothetical protein
MMKFQFHIVGRADDICHVETRDLRSHEKFPAFVLQTKVSWSKRDCPDQILLGSNDTDFVYFLHYHVTWKVSSLFPKETHVFSLEEPKGKTSHISQKQHIDMHLGRSGSNRSFNNYYGKSEVLLGHTVSESSQLLGRQNMALPTPKWRYEAAGMVTKMDGL